MARTKVFQSDLALAAVLDGANTAWDIAQELNVSYTHATVIVDRLLREKALRWTGTISPQPHGRGRRVYEVAI